MRLFSTLTVVAAAGATAPTLSAQSQPSAALKSQLRNLVVAQESYYADHGICDTLTAAGR